MQKEARLPTLKTRLNELMGELSATKFAEELGLSRQTVGFYLNGDRIPDAATILRICQKCDVSSDWLLGLSEVRKTDASTQSTCSFTGLSERAVDYLRTLYLMQKSDPNDNRIAILSAMLERHFFDYMLALCGRYVRLMSMTSSPHYSGTADYIAMSDALRQHGFVISTPAEQANAIFSEQITLLLRTVLTDIVEKNCGKQGDPNLVDLDSFLSEEK